MPRKTCVFRKRKDVNCVGPFLPLLLCIFTFIPFALFDLHPHSWHKRIWNFYNRFFFRFSLFKNLVEYFGSFRTRNRHSLPAPRALSFLLCRLRGTRSTTPLFGVCNSLASTVISKLFGYLTVIWGVLFVSNKSVWWINYIIYGTKMKICRPIIHQRVYFFGLKRYHSVKVQWWMAHYGLIVHFYDPVPGKTHDLKVYDGSHLQDIFDEDRFRNFCLFGDQVHKRDATYFVLFQEYTCSTQKKILIVFCKNQKLVVKRGSMRVIQFWQAYQRLAFLRSDYMPEGQMY